MGKKRAAVAVSTPAVAFPAPAAEPEADHFSDYGFDPQLLRFFSPQPEVKRLWGRRQRHHQQQPQSAQLKPLDSARFKLQKPISKKHHLQKQQQRRQWWSSAASAALRLFKKQTSSSIRPAAAAVAPTPSYGSAAAPTAVPLYLADYGGDDDDGAAACACWAPAVRSGGSRLAAAELGAAALAVPYVSLRSTSLAGGRTEGAPVMPIYLVT